LGDLRLATDEEGMDTTEAAADSVHTCRVLAIVTIMPVKNAEKMASFRKLWRKHGR
jgi:hypothetical protein